MVSSMLVNRGEIKTTAGLEMGTHSVGFKKNPTEDIDALLDVTISLPINPQGTFNSKSYIFVKVEQVNYGYFCTMKDY